MTYPQNNRGNVPVFMARQDEMNKAGDFPVTLSNYYKPDDVPAPKAIASGLVQRVGMKDECIY